DQREPGRRRIAARPTGCQQGRGDQRGADCDPGGQLAAQRECGAAARRQARRGHHGGAMMMQGMLVWWRNHSSGERRLMAALGIIALVIFLWLGVLRPVAGALERGWERQGAALDRYASVRAKVAELRRRPSKRAAADRVPMAQLIGQSAAEAGFTLDR